MNIKRVNPLAKGSAANSKTIALGKPQKPRIDFNDNSISFIVNDIDTSKAILWRVTISQAELELLLEKFTPPVTHP